MFIHFSDTHLGFSEFNKVDPKTGFNQRELDVYRSFKWVVDFILKSKPEFIIHSGDLFETSRPPNRTISFALTQVKRISEAKIPFIIISGNHSTPRMSVSGSIFESFKILPNIFPVYQGEYEKIKVGNYLFHCIPHCSTEKIMKKNIKKAKPEKGFKNILITHAGIISSGKSFDTGEFNEQKIPLEAIEKNNFSYVALGHYHRFQKVSQNAYFPGATERFSFRHAKYETGILQVDSKSFMPKFIEAPSRPMYRFNLKCKDKKPGEILKNIHQIAKKCKKGSLALINFKDVKRDVWLSLDHSRILDSFSHTFLTDLRPSFYQAEDARYGKTSIDDLPIEFDRFVKSLKKDDDEKKLIKELGVKYLTLAES
jgi:DNA repair protein SbcD/Mre11